jgi:glycosyltransferase involved in cell wall biosynthesis
MKILFYSYKSTHSGKSYGGAERSMTVMSEAFAEYGQDVYFLSGRDGVRYAKSKEQQINSVAVHFLPVIRLFYLRNPVMRFLNDLIRTFIFKTYLTRNFKDVDIIYVYNEYPAAYQVIQWRNRHSKTTKIVYRAAGLYWHNKILVSHPNLKSKVEYVFQNVDLVNYISSGIKDLFVEIKINNNYTYNFRRELILDIGVEMVHSDRKWRYNSRAEFIIVMVARFSDYQKRQDVLMEAFKEWNNPSAKLVFIGNGSELKKFKTTAENNEFLRESVEFCGFLEHENIVNHLLESSVFCMCTDYEGLSKAVIEALSLGVPLLLSDVLAINSYIKNGENGFLVKNTVEEWKLALETIYSRNKLDLESLSQRQISFAREHFDILKNTNTYLEQFESLINRE